MKRLLIWVVLCVATAGAGWAAEGLKAKPERSDSLRREAQASILRGLQFLEKKQLPDGSWAQHPAITALIVDGMMRSGLEGYGPDGRAVKAGLAFVRKHVRKDGGIYARFYANYSTSICLMALYRANRPEDRETLLKARQYLLALQADKGEKIGKSDPRYGGFGYEQSSHPGQGMRHPDLSNSQWALEALKVTESLETGDRPAPAKAAGQTTAAAMDRALVFLARCQNLKAVNDREWASNDGGFVYSPVESKAGEAEEGAGLRSYGGMTYAGLKSMIYANVDKNDKRVTAAYEWIRSHWTLKENPGMGQQGLFYYYQTLAKALDAYGREIVVDAAGKRHDWRTEVTRHLLSIQEGDGSWVNRNSRWMESMPELVTAYCVLTLEATLEGW